MKRSLVFGLWSLNNKGPRPKAKGQRPKSKRIYEFSNASTTIRGCRSAARHADDDLDGAATPFDARRAASRTGARRRNRLNGDTRYRLSPHRHGEALRVQEVSARHR